MNNWHYELTWFGAGKNDAIVGSVILSGVTQKDVRKWFYLSDEDEACGGCYTVNASQKLELDEWVEGIDLNKYVYFVEDIAN